MKPDPEKSYSPSLIHKKKRLPVNGWLTRSDVNRFMVSIKPDCRPSLPTQYPRPPSSLFKQRNADGLPVKKRTSRAPWPDEKLVSTWPREALVCGGHRLQNTHRPTALAYHHNKPPRRLCYCSSGCLLPVTGTIWRSCRGTIEEIKG